MFRRNPNNNSAERGRDIRMRLTAGFAGSAVLAGCAALYVSSEVPGARLGGMLYGTVGLGIMTMPFVMELAERYRPEPEGGKGGGSRRPPDEPAPRVPSGQDNGGDLIREIEEYLDTQQPISV